MEAGKVDEVFMNSGMGAESSSTVALINSNLFHCLEPLTSFPVKTYTKSKIILTGIIDHPDNLRLMSTLFFKSLVHAIKFHAPQPFPEKYNHHHHASTNYS